MESACYWYRLNWPKYIIYTTLWLWILHFLISIFRMTLLRLIKRNRRGLNLIWITYTVNVKNLILYFLISLFWMTLFRLIKRNIRSLNLIWITYIVDVKNWILYFLISIFWMTLFRLIKRNGIGFNFILFCTNWNW